jgi:hypothetical protein
MDKAKQTLNSFISRIIYTLQNLSIRNVLKLAWNTFSPFTGFEVIFNLSLDGSSLFVFGSIIESIALGSERCFGNFAGEPLAYPM